jgi:hypothetical protein
LSRSAGLAFADMDSALRTRIKIRILNYDPFAQQARFDRVLAL